MIEQHADEDGEVFHHRGVEQYVARAVGCEDDARGQTIPKMVFEQGNRVADDAGVACRKFWSGRRMQC